MDLPRLVLAALWAALFLSTFGSLFYITMIRPH